MTTQAWTWVISNEAERFGRSGIDDFVNVDAHFVGNDFHLVHQADVYGTVDVFQKFGQLGSFGGAYWNNFIDGRLVQRKADSKQAGVWPPMTLGMVRVSKLGLPGSSRSGE